MYPKVQKIHKIEIIFSRFFISEINEAILNCFNHETLSDFSKKKVSTNQTKIDHQG